MDGFELMSGKRENMSKGGSQRKRRYKIAACLILLALIASCLFLFNDGAVFVQSMAPVGGIPVLTALVAFIPSLMLMLLMSMGKLKSMTVVLMSLFSSVLLALVVWRMPLLLVGQSILFGGTVAIMPILWALFHAMWIFQLLVDSGYFDKLRRSLQKVSPDRRVQTILVGFGLTAVLESIAAFGAPIVIATSMLTGLGFAPHLAASVALIANSAPSSWGTQGMPLLMLSSVTGLDVNHLGAIVAWQTPLITALLPLGLVILVSGRKGLRGIWPLALISGAGYAATAILCATYISVSITGIAAGIVSMSLTLLWSRYFKPKNLWLFDNEVSERRESESQTKGELLRAWSPFLVLIAIVTLFNGTGFAENFDRIGNISFAWPKLDGLVFSVDPHTGLFSEYSARYSQNLLTSGGTLVLISGWICAPLIRMKPRQVLRSYWTALKNMLPAGGTIACIMGMAYLMNYSGMASSIGLAVSKLSVSVLPFFMVLLGLVGCVLAGSVAGGNALFGGASLFAAKQLGIDPYFVTGTLCSGGTLGKPITPQNIVLAEAAMGQHDEGQPAKLISRVFIWVAFYTVLMFVLVFIQSLIFLA